MPIRAGRASRSFGVRFPTADRAADGPPYTMTSHPFRTRAVALAAAGAAVALAASASGAQRARFTAATLTEPAAKALAVTGTLSDLVAGSRARVVVPTSWQQHSAPAGRLRLSTTRGTNCRYDMTYAVRSVLAPAQDAAAYAAATLPAASSRHLLDSGQRGRSAFRVVRQPGVGGRVRVDALWVGVLTKRADIAPAPMVAWTQITVTARSRAGDECHAGTWREALGPSIGDSLAVARSDLRFTKKP